MKYNAGISATYKMRYNMKTILVIILSFLVGSSFAEGEWSKTAGTPRKPYFSVLS